MSDTMKTPPIQALLSSTMQEMYTESLCPQPFRSCLPPGGHGEDTQRPNISLQNKKRNQRGNFLHLPVFLMFPEHAHSSSGKGGEKEENKCC